MTPSNGEGSHNLMNVSSSDSRECFDPHFLYSENTILLQKSVCDEVSKLFEVVVNGSGISFVKRRNDLQNVSQISPVQSVKEIYDHLLSFESSLEVKKSSQNVNGWTRVFCLDSKNCNKLSPNTSAAYHSTMRRLVVRNYSDSMVHVMVQIPKELRGLQLESGDYCYVLKIEIQGS